MQIGQSNIALNTVQFSLTSLKRPPLIPPIHWGEIESDPLPLALRCTP